MRLPQPERSGASNALLATLIVASLVVTTVYFREPDDGLLHRARRGTQAVTAPVAAVGDWLFTPVDAVRGWVGGLGVSRSEAEALRTQNAELRLRLAELEEARLENERLRALVGFIEARDLDAIGARIIGRSTSAYEGTILIDRGTDAGVTVGMPVLAPEGLLGQTIEVTAFSAKVRLITDQNSGVAAMIQSSRAEGIVRGSIEGAVAMEYVSRETTVTVGDVALTSGMGGVYPKGLLIGEVTLSELRDNDLFPRIEITPSASVAGLEEVVVLIGAAPQPELGAGE